jgi:hypothetical protein
MHIVDRENLGVDEDDVVRDAAFQMELGRIHETVLQFYATGHGRTGDFARAELQRRFDLGDDSIVLDTDKYWQAYAAQPHHHENP